MNELKQAINFYISNLSWIDFASYAWVFLVFIAAICLSLYIISKHILFGVVVLIFSLIVSAIGAVYVSKFLDENLRARNVIITDKKQLLYSDTLIIDINLTNLSKKPFKHCNVALKFYTPSSNFLKNEIAKLKPFFRSSLALKEPVLPLQTAQLQSVIDNFRFENYDIITKSECY